MGKHKATHQVNVKVRLLNSGGILETLPDLLTLENKLTCAKSSLVTGTSRPCLDVTTIQKFSGTSSRHLLHLVAQLYLDFGTPHGL